MLDRVGALRRSSVITTHGPGSIVDFRAPGCGAPISGVISGLEWWDDAAADGFQGVRHRQWINEVRLQARLHVAGFRLPPVKPDNQRRRGKEREDNNVDVLPVIRFPSWLQCPSCDRIKSAPQWGQSAGSPERWCESPGCSVGNERSYAVPVRFIVACSQGHLGEFPWKWWIGCRCKRPKLYLKTRGPGLGGKLVECGMKGCVGTPRSLEGCFRKTALQERGLGCQGREPWLRRHEEGSAQCGEEPRVLQRGASNVYYGSTLSALSIPPFSSDLSSVFGRYWENLKDKSPEDWPALIKLLDLDKEIGEPVDVLVARLSEWKAALDADDPSQALEWAEYMQFRRSGERPVADADFSTQPVDPPLELAPYIASVVQASRLREVRALLGFTRISPPSGVFAAGGQELGRIYLQKPNWLPGIAMQGEGIFLRLSTERLAAWSSLDQVRDRAMPFVEFVRERLRSEDDQRPVDEALAARFILLHSLSHALMRRLSLDCGYSSSALRERLYVDSEPHPMEGILIHTGSPDSEGTLGGLVRQGDPTRLWETLSGALAEMAWCSSDPVCITGTATLSSPQNGAACHACLLVPETSCQHFNALLYRALMVGTERDPTIGFFSTLREDFGL